MKGGEDGGVERVMEGKVEEWEGLRGDGSEHEKRGKRTEGWKERGRKGIFRSLKF